MDKAEIHIGEIEHQIRDAKMCFEDYRKARQDNDIPLIFFYVHHFVVHAANIDKLLQPKPANQRMKILEKYFDLRGINLKEFRRLRNHLEHFDERLDNWISNYDGHTFFDTNLVDGTRGFPEKAFLRAMDGDIFKFYGENYDLATMFTQLLEIEKQITKDWRNESI
jgi:hypothetical protein